MTLVYTAVSLSRFRGFVFSHSIHAFHVSNYKVSLKMGMRVRLVVRWESKSVVGGSCFCLGCLSWISSVVMLNELAYTEVIDLQ
jgi:hypothetical protein